MLTHEPAGFSSAPLVAEMSAAFDAQLTELPAGEVLRTAFPLINPNGASISYAHQALDYGTRPRSEVEIWVPTSGGFQKVTTKEALRDYTQNHLWMPDDDAESVELVQALNGRTDLGGAVPLLPGVTKEGDAKIRGAIDPRIDLDSVSPYNEETPTTPVAVVRFAEFVVGQPLATYTGNIAVLGYGALVGEPLFNQALPESGANMDNVTLFPYRADIGEGIERMEKGEFDLVLSVFGAASKIRRIPRGTAVVDAGYAISEEDGKPHGNIHPDALRFSPRRHGAWARVYGRKGTAFYGGTGPVTIAEAEDRSVKRRLAALRTLAGTTVHHA